MRFKVTWTQRHHAVIVARTEEDAKAIALGLGDADTLIEMGPVAVDPLEAVR